MSQHEPMFNIHSSVLALLALLAAMQLLMQAVSVEWANWLTLALAFIPAHYTNLAEPWPGGDVSAVTSFVTYALLHADWMHLGFNAAWLVAFGGAIANRVGSVRFLSLFVFCAVAGAAVFLVWNIGLPVPMVGASGAISGLMGASMRFLFTAIDGDGLAALRENPRAVPLMPLRQALADRRVVLVTVVFLVANLLAVMGLGSVGVSGIAWEAHIGGYFAGLLFFGFFDALQTEHSSGSAILH